MYSVLLTIHILITLFLIGIILVQRSASDSNGLSASSSTSIMSGRAAANAMTRATSILAAAFLCTSLGLGILTAHSHATEISIMDKIDAGQHAADAPLVRDNKQPVTAPGQPVSGHPATPAVPRPE